MRVEVEVTRTKAYFAEAFAEGIRFTTWRRWTPHMVVVLLTFGIFAVNERPEDWYLGGFFIGAAVYEAFKIWYTRQVWIRDRMAGKTANHTARYVFTDDVIESAGPYSEGTLSWDGIHEVRASDVGLNLLIEKGIGIYIPRRAFPSTEAFEFVVSKVATIRRR